MTAARDNGIFHEILSASAGAGKTYALVTRFLALLFSRRDAHGAFDPSGIAALTFTRKSAGEFLQKIMRRLGDAAADADALAALNRDFEKFGVRVDRAAALAALEACVRRLDRLRLETIDAFCMEYLRAFAEEAGIFSKISTLDDFHAAEASAEALETLMDGANRDAQAFKELAQAVKEMSFGKESKSFSGRLMDAFSTVLNLADAPRLGAELWGNLDPWTDAFLDAFPREAYAQDCECLCDDWPQAIADKGEEVLAFFAPLPETSEFGACTAFVGRLCETFGTDGGFYAGYTVKTRANAKAEYPLSPEACAALERLFHTAFQWKLSLCARATRALYSLACDYNAVYGETVTARGQLAFSDVSRLLASPTVAAMRPFFESRLDARIRHWLFDEFQDTSRAQWAVFENLVDEAFQDDSGERTFFCVGDVKQSIYGWRGGDSRLFDEIRARYANLRDGAPLVVSYRSAAPIIDWVNAIFGGNALASAFRAEAAERFAACFKPHRVAPRTPPLSGCVSAHRVPTPAGDEDVYRAIGAFLERTNPPAHGLSCAVLVYKNDTARALADFLRGAYPAIPVAAELDAPIAAGNLEIPAFVQCLRALAHPDDTMARVYLQMTPLWEWARGFSENFAADAICLIEAEGVGAFAQRYEDALRARGTSGEFFETTMSALASACRAFDASGSRDIDAAARFLETATTRLAAPKNAVQVLTVHKSKGLEYDCVILPVLKKFGADWPKGLHALNDEAGVPQSVLMLPKKDDCLLNREFAAAVERLQADEDFEGICALYVATTRAKRALAVFLPEKPLKSGARVEAGADALFLQTLAGVNGAHATADGFAFGDDDWFTRAEAPAPVAEAAALPAVAASAPKAEDVAAAPSPSHIKTPVAADADADARIAFGTAIHAAFEALDGADDAAVRAALARSGAPEELRARLESTLANALQTPEIRALFAAPAGDVRREWAYTLADASGRTQHGVIDRLEILRDAAGAIVGARIYDFKSSTVDAAANYGAQLNAYRAAVCALLKLDAARVETFIVGYADAKICPVCPR